MRLQSIALIAVVAIAVIATTTVAVSYLKSPPILSIELNPSSPIEAKQGSEFSLGISVRNKAGLLIAEAKNVRGLLELPEGFIEKAFQTNTRQLIFGGIDAGDASHYGLTIIVSNTAEIGEHHARLTISGANIPTETIDIVFTVRSP
jgi:hypothetical protein